MSLSLLASSSLDPYISDHFPLLTSNKRKEEALRPRLIIHLVTTLPGSGMGGNGNLGSVTKRFVSFGLRAVPSS